MNKRIKARWLKALRSGKYEQGKQALRPSNGGFCCLGVLCDLHRKSTKRIGWHRRHNDTMTYIGNSEILPEPVAKWAGLESDPSVGVGLKKRYLSELNDRAGSSFKKIAKVIEKYL